MATKRQRNQNTLSHEFILSIFCIGLGSMPTAREVLVLFIELKPTHERFKNFIVTFLFVPKKALIGERKCDK